MINTKLSPLFMRLFRDNDTSNLNGNNIDRESGKLVGFLQAWPRMWTQTSGQDLKISGQGRACGLQVQCCNLWATQPPQ